MKRSPSALRSMPPATGPSRRGSARTLVALAIAGAILGMGSLALGEKVAKDGSAESIQTTRALVRAVRAWQREQAADECPTPSRLERDGSLPKGAAVEDAWGQRVRLSCDGTSITARSAGPDGRLGTLDDIVSTGQSG